MDSNNYIFICGEGSCSDGTSSILTTKEVLLVNLSTNWPVRTHSEENANDPRNDKATLFRNIATSYVFLFIFNEETTMNSFYLNQLGIAFARGVPIVGIREPSYIMPNPLPEYYYSTEIVDFNEPKANARNKPNGRSSKTTLSDLLVDCFCSAIVYSTDFHKHCLERLFRKVTDAYAKAKKERFLPPSLTLTDFGKTCSKSGETTIRQKVLTSLDSFKCPKCGSHVKGGRKSSVLRKTSSVDNLLHDSHLRSPAPRPHNSDAPQLMITKSVLRPIMGQSLGQSSFSKSVFHGSGRRPATSVIRKTSSAKTCSQIKATTRATTADQSRPMSTNSAPVTSSYNKVAKVPEENAQRNMVSTATQETGFSIREKPTTGFITNKRGALLRKMSSLPCIPTTYLVAEPGCEKPALVKYPPVNILDDPDGLPEFTDDEDKETIHISRIPSPAISTCSTNIESE